MPANPPALVAKVERIHETLNWTPEYDDLNTIVKASLAWEKVLPEKQSHS